MVNKDYHDDDHILCFSLPKTMAWMDPLQTLLH